MKVRTCVCQVLLVALVLVAAQEEEVFQNVVEELTVETVVSFFCQVFRESRWTSSVKDT